MNRAMGIVISLVSLVITLGIIGTRYIGRQYPVLPLIVGTGVLLLTLLSIRSKSYHHPTLTGVVVLSTFYRVYIFLYPASFIGADSDKYAFYIQRLLLYGDTSAVGLGFYKFAPNYLIYNAISALITDLPIRYALTVIPLLIGVFIPLVAYIVARRIGLSQPMGIIAASFTVLIPSTLLFSYNPVAQSLSVPIALSAIIVLTINQYQNKSRTILLGLLLFIALIFTHKLAPLILVVSLFLAGILRAIQALLFDYEMSYNRRLTYFGLGIIFFVSYYFQWVFTYIDSLVISRLITILFGNPANSINIQTNPTAAQLITENFLYVVLLNVGYLVPIVLLAGVGWLILFFRYKEDVAILLSLVAVQMTMTTLSFAGILSSIPIRFFFIITPFVAVLATVTLSQIHSAHWISRRHMKTISTIIVLILVLAPQAVALGGPSDSTLEQRGYLTPAELEAKHWTNQHVDGRIATDDFYASEIPPSLIKPYAKHFQSPPNKYKSATVQLLNASLNRTSTCWFAVRQGATRFGMQGRWKLTYDPKSLTTKANKIYTSGMLGTSIAKHNHCQNSTLPMRSLIFELTSARS
jgi:hypothetical protein